MKPDQARIIARLAHKGQKYGNAGYFEFHVENVVRRCEGNPHCTFGLVTLALLHDVIEDTDLSYGDLRALGLNDAGLNTLEALTKRENEDYASYITRVLKNDGAVFVKYHDLRENLHQCTDSAKDPVRWERNRSLRKRYVAALDRIIESSPYFMYEV